MINSRNRTADILKGVAVILMVQVHIIELFALPQIYDSTTGSILLFLGGPPAAPIFMAVMGYFIAFGNSNFSKSIIRGIKLIVGGLLLNFGLNFHLFIKIYNQTIITSPWPYLFGVDILFLAGLSIIIISVLHKLFKNNPIPYILTIVLIFVINSLLPPPTNTGIFSYFTALIYSDIWWSYFPVIPWLAYPLTGYVLYLIEPLISGFIKKRVVQISIFAISGVILVLSISYGILVASKLHAYYHHDFLYYLFTLNFMIFWSILFNFVTIFSDNFITSFIEWLGKKVTVFYVFQWLIIGNIGTALYKTQNIFQLVFWFISIMIVTSLLTYLYYRIKQKKAQ